jgi:hypothetical protein
MRLRSCCLLFCAALPALAQLAPEQKLLDFQQLGAMFAKRYAFTEWKQAALNWDSLNLEPWLTRVSQSKSDLEFFEICAEYVAKNQDGHTAFILPSSFDAQLPFDVDLYDGKFVLDRIDRTQLRAGDYPFVVGDELVSIDGVAAAEQAAKFAVFVGDGNPRSVQRVAASLLTYRPQWLLPRAHEEGDTANVVIRRQNGDLGSYVIPWTKEGTPYTTAGPVPVPKESQPGSVTPTYLPRRTRSSDALGGSAPATKASAPDDVTPPYMRRLMGFQNLRLAAPRFAVGVDTLAPVFALPPDFAPRLGKGKYDTLYTGTYQSGGKRIGFMRIPDFEYVSSTDLSTEVKFLQANTDGLVVDIMRNPGGSGCTVEQVMSYLNPGGFYSLGNKVRATWDMVMGMESDLEDAEYYGATDDEISALKGMLDQLQRAFAENRGFTPPQPLCGLSISISPARDRSGNEITYSKPILVLTDELSASAAEIFAAVMQDEKRATIYGARTDGAGGAVVQFPVGVYMECYLDYAESMLTRKYVIDSSGQFPRAPYIENIGVLPDVADDYMTMDNLLNQGRSFVERFTQTLVGRIP